MPYSIIITAPAPLTMQMDAGRYRRGRSPPMVSVYWRIEPWGKSRANCVKQSREIYALAGLKNSPAMAEGKSARRRFGVSPQQWSPWERGRRIPDELRLSQLAKFFNVSVEWLRRDHTRANSSDNEWMTPDAGETPDRESPNKPDLHDAVFSAGLTVPELYAHLYRLRMKAVYRVEVMVTDVRYVPIPQAVPPKTP